MEIKCRRAANLSQWLPLGVWLQADQTQRNIHNVFSTLIQCAESASTNGKQATIHRWRSIAPSGRKNMTVLNCRCGICWKIFPLVVNVQKDFWRKKPLRFVKNWPIFLCFWQSRPGFRTLRKSPSSSSVRSRKTRSCESCQIWLKSVESSPRSVAHSCRIWCKSLERRLINLDGRKKMQTDAKHYNKEILKNCIFARTAI